MQWNEVPARCLDVTSLVLLHFVLIEYLLGFINPLLHVAYIIQYHPSSSISWDFHFYQRIENVRTMLQSSSEFILFRFSLTWSLSRDYFWILGFIFFLAVLQMVCWSRSSYEIRGYLSFLLFFWIISLGCKFFWCY